MVEVLNLMGYMSGVQLFKMQKSIMVIILEFGDGVS